MWISIQVKKKRDNTRRVIKFHKNLYGLKKSMWNGIPILFRHWVYKVLISASKQRNFVDNLIIFNEKKKINSNSFKIWRPSSILTKFRIKHDLLLVHRAQNSSSITRNLLKSDNLEEIFKKFKISKNVNAPIDTVIFNSQMY